MKMKDLELRIENLEKTIENLSPKTESKPVRFKKLRSWAQFAKEQARRVRLQSPITVR